MEDRNENMRRLNEMALAYGQKRKSAQTGYLHYHYNLNDQESHLSIPVVENFLFALALLRSRHVEGITEAKTMLDGLLHFQNHQMEAYGNGNFPIYLHDYPNCKDRFIAVHVACILYWIIKSFHHVIGQDLKKRLEEALLTTITHSIKAHLEKSAPYPIMMKIAAVAKSGGMLLQNKEVETKGESLLAELLANPDRSSWYCPSSLGTMLTSLTMVYPRLSDSPWNSLWKHVENTWHRQTSCYVGPSLREWQQGKEPQVTLYDMFMGYLAGVFPERVKKDSLAHLEAVLISSTDDVLNELTYPFKLEGTIGEASWTLLQNKNWAYSVLDSHVKANPGFEKAVHPFRLVWGNLQHVHTFVCQGGNHQIKECIAKGNRIDFIFALIQPAEVEDREKSREILFFSDIHDEQKFLTAGNKSSTFLLDEEFSMQSETITLSLKFHLEEGKGRFFGHRMLGNRPFQLNNKGSQRYEAFDWQVFLRTVARAEDCIIHVSISIKEDLEEN